MVKCLSIAKKSFVILICLSICCIFCSCGLYSMNNLPTGELIDQEISPGGKYKVNSYLVSGNATVDFSVRCEVVEIATGSTRNIYWQYHMESADVVWIDDHTVNINGVVLDVQTDSYDWREH